MQLADAGWIKRQSTTLLRVVSRIGSLLSEFYLAADKQALGPPVANLCCTEKHESQRFIAVIENGTMKCLQFHDIGEECRAIQMPDVPAPQ
jgi:hypothetical protein